MRTVKVILFNVALLAGLLVLSISGLVLYQSVDKEDTFVLENATIQSPDYLNRLAGMGEKTRFQNRRKLFSCGQSPAGGRRWNHICLQILYERRDHGG